MKRSLQRHAGGAILLLCAAVAMGAADSDVGDLTADELVAQADGAYQAGDFPRAATLYQKLFDDFGKSSDPLAQEALRKRSVPLALSYIQSSNFERAGAAIATALNAKPESAQSQELLFWRGVCLLQTGNFSESQQALEEFLAQFPPGSERDSSFIKKFPAALKSPEARLMLGSTLLLQEKPGDAARFFEEIAPSLPPAERGRAIVLRLHALMAADDYDAALELVKREFPRMEEIPQMIGFQTLTLELGSHFLDKERPRDAIACLQRVWSAERLQNHQKKRLADIEMRLAAAEANPSADPFQKITLGQQAAKTRREIEQFAKLEGFDAGTRMRLAAAYQNMERHREAALILEAMLEDLPPSPLTETASVSLIQNWNATQRWPKTIATAQSFSETFPASPNLPLVRYLQGLAEQQTGDHTASNTTFQTLFNESPDSEFAPRAHFMIGFNHLLMEDNDGAIAVFGDFLKTRPDHELAEAALYWRGMGYSLNKEYVKARKVFGEYLDRHKEGTFRSAAFFRRAYCAQQLEDYDVSIRELRDYLKKHPEGEESSEARVLLGDALMNEGRLEEGITVLEGIPDRDVRFYEEGVFKSAKALKLLEEYPRLEKLMKEFVRQNPRSPRIAEAILNQGWIYRQEGDMEKARRIYWEALEKFGNDPDIRSVEDLFPALAKLYQGEEGLAEYLRALDDLGENAKPVLALRAQWARARALRKRDPEAARALLVGAARSVEPSETHPLIMADIAQALSEAGESTKSEGLWKNLLKWNPRAPQKDRVFASLGLAELERGNEKAALKYFERFERETLGSPLFGRVMLARAKLMEKRGHRAEALRSLEALLASEFAVGPEKCEALFRSGEIHLRSGKPELAVPYFQRIFVMHGRWADWVARAYLRSGEAFEKLGDLESARRTYAELSGRTDLEGFPESATARKRLEELGAPAPQESTPHPG